MSARTTTLARARFWLLLVLTPAAFAPALCNELPWLAFHDGVTVPAWQAVTAWDVLAPTALLLAWMAHCRCSLRALLVLAVFATLLAVCAPARNVVEQDHGHAWVTAPIEFSPHSMDALAGPLALCSRAHPFGTDLHGRDVCARILFGMRDSIGLAFAAAALALLIGGVTGCCAALCGGRVEALCTLVAQALSAFPALLVVLVLQGLAAPSLLWLLLLLVVFRMGTVYRLVRGEAARLMGRPWMAAARADGLPLVTLLRRELLPHLLAPLGVNMAFGVAAVIMLEGSLTFLGFGVPAPLPSLGELLHQGRDLLPAWTRLLLLPCALLVGTTALCMRLGTALREAAAEREA
ncbi:MAG: ABC transporter permease [Planctomycetes bacterium]|nr:ABC transporter permease [Planctomycetota bacterium]